MYFYIRNFIPGELQKAVNLITELKLDLGSKTLFFGLQIAQIPPEESLCATEIWTAPGHALWLLGFIFISGVILAREDWKTTKQLLFLPAGGGGALSKPQLNMASL